MCPVPEEYGSKSLDIQQVLLDKISPYFQYLELLVIHGEGEPLLSRNIDFFIRASLNHNLSLAYVESERIELDELGRRIASAGLKLTSA